MLKMNIKGAVIVLLIALSLRLLLILSVLLKNHEGIYVYDSYGYWQIGYNVLENGIFSQDHQGTLNPDAFRTPLYPLLLSGLMYIGAGSFGMLLLQLLLSSLTAVIVYNCSRRLFAQKNISLIAGLIIALDIPSIIFTGLILTESIFTFLFAASLYHMIVYLQGKNKSSLIYSGIFHGLAMLCRPVALITFFIFLTIILFSDPSFRTRVKRIFIYGITVLLVLSPWLMRNKVVFNSFFLSRISAHVLHNYHAASILSEKMNITFHDAQVQLRLQSTSSFKGDAVKEPVRYAEHCRQKAIEVIAHNKGIFLKQHAYGVFSLMFKPVRGYIDNMLGYTRGYNRVSTSQFPINTKVYAMMKELSSKLSFTLVIVQAVMIIIIYLGAVKGAISWWKHANRLMLVMLLLLIAYFLNATVPPFNEGRLRIPAMPLLAIVSAYGLNRFAFFLKRRS